jgi:hypothetical protein
MLNLHLNNSALGELVASSFPFGGFFLDGRRVLREQLVVAEYAGPYWISGGCPYRSIILEPEVMIRFKSASGKCDIGPMTNLQSAIGVFWSDCHEPFAELPVDNTWRLLKDGSKWPQAQIFSSQSELAVT